MLDARDNIAQVDAHDFRHAIHDTRAIAIDDGHIRLLRWLLSAMVARASESMSFDMPGHEEP